VKERNNSAKCSTMTAQCALLDRCEIGTSGEGTEQFGEMLDDGGTMCSSGQKMERESTEGAGMNKFGFRTAGFSRWKLVDAFAALRRVGYDGVELCFEAHELCAGTRVNAGALTDAVEGAKDYGLEFASFSYHGDADKLPLRNKRTESVIEAAGECGVGVLIINAPRIVLGKKERQFRDLVTRLKQFSRRAERSGVLLALEPEPFLAIEGAEDMLRLLDAVGSKALNVNLDVGHAYIVDQDVPAYIRLLKRRIVHTHFEDIAGKVHKHLVPGEGDMPLKAIVAALRKAKYAGYFTVDLFNIHDAPEDFAGRALRGLHAITDVT
jgi:sugar phosphate isomerase/epimerase